MATPVFYVGALDGNGNVASRSIPATFLYVNGQPVVDPIAGNSQKYNIYDDAGNIIQNANPNNYLIVPASYTITEALGFASQVSNLITSSGVPTALATMTGAFTQGGSQDLQRNLQWNIPSGLVVPAFTDAASFNLGLVTGSSGLPLAASTFGGGTENVVNSYYQDLKQAFGLQGQTIDTSGSFGLSAANTANINAGFQAAAAIQLTMGNVEGVTTLNQDSSGNFLANYVQSQNGQPISKEGSYQEANSGQIVTDASTYNSNTGAKTSEIVQATGATGSNEGSAQVAFGSGNSPTATV